MLNLFKNQHKKCLLIHDLVETCQSWDGQPEEVVDATDQVTSEDGNRDEQHVHVELLQRFNQDKQNGIFLHDRDRWSNLA